MFLKAINRPIILFEVILSNCRCPIKGSFFPVLVTGTVCLEVPAISQRPELNKHKFLSLVVFSSQVKQQRVLLKRWAARVCCVVSLHRPAMSVISQRPTLEREP